MKKRIICILLLLLCSLSACSKEVKLSEYSCFDCGFDTFWKFYTYSDNEEETNTYFTYMKERSVYLHQLFDIYHTYEGINNLKTINDNAGVQAVQVDPIIIDLIKLAKTISEASNGHFDITDGALFKVWHNYRDEGKALNQNGEYGKIPPLETLEEASSHKGFDKIIIDETSSTVFITDPNVSLDVGGIAKGYSVELIAQELIAMGFEDGSLNAGGNLRIIGLNPKTKVQNTSIQDPRNANGFQATAFIRFALKEPVSVVTSGNYINYYYAEGDLKLHHIIDPETLYPSTHYDSVTIFTKDAGLADSLSTTLFTVSLEEGLDIIEEIETIFNTNIEVCWIYPEDAELNPDLYTKDGVQYYYTEGLEDYIIE